MGTLERVGSEIATSNNALSVSRVGAGYSNGVYTNVNLFAITGAGSSATGIVTVIRWSFTAVSITSSAKGHGYSKGDIVGLATADMISGGGAQISVDAISGVDTLISYKCSRRKLYTWSRFSYKWCSSTIRCS